MYNANSPNGIYIWCLITGNMSMGKQSVWKMFYIIFWWISPQLLVGGLMSYLLLLPYSGVQHILYIWATRWCLMGTGTAYHLGSPLVFGGVHVAHLFFLSWVAFLCFVCVRPMSCESNVSYVSECPFLIYYKPFSFL